jgi:hypothetical protein
MGILEFTFRILGNVFWIVLAVSAGKFSEIIQALINIVQLFADNIGWLF